MGALLRVLWLWARRKALQTAAKTGLRKATSTVARNAVTRKITEGVATGVGRAVARAGGSTLTKKALGFAVRDVLVPTAVLAGIAHVVGPSEEDVEVDEDFLKDLNDALAGDDGPEIIADLEQYIAAMQGRTVVDGRDPSWRMIKLSRDPEAFLQIIRGLSVPDGLWGGETRAFPAWFNNRFVDYKKGSFETDHAGADLNAPSPGKLGVPAWMGRFGLEDQPGANGGPGHPLNTILMVRDRLFDREEEAAFDYDVAVSDLFDNLDQYARYCRMCSLDAVSWDSEKYLSFKSVFKKIGSVAKKIVSNPIVSTIAGFVPGVNVVHKAVSAGLEALVPSKAPPEPTATQMAQVGALPTVGTLSPASVLSLAQQLLKDHIITQPPESSENMGDLVRWKLGEIARPRWLDVAGKGWQQMAVDVEQIINDVDYELRRRNAQRVGLVGPQARTA